ncbi:hypothetical protein ACJMK2_039657 [Sinanodonta woodiana]|uniref:Uncharacterized protein n=1 Tax=Sinanodonta woodiana TaxID=1069815 RepID=A0ABD3WG01_SINWO
MSNTIISVNESILVEKQKFVNEVNLLTAYNRRPQSGGEAATQYVAIVMEHSTRKKTSSLRVCCKQTVKKENMSTPKLQKK